MSQAPTPTGLMPRSKPETDIFGVLLIIATAFVLAATVFVIYKTSMLLGTPLPVPGD